MPINYLRYHPDWKDIIRPEALKRAKHRCQKCFVPNRALIIYDSEDHWLQVDDLISNECKKTGQKIIRIVLTTAHLNHLVIDNRPENLNMLCQRCHLNHDREHNKLMNRFAKLTVFDELVKELQEPGSEKALPQVFATYRAKRNQYLHLMAILEKRTKKGYTAKYDKSVLKLANTYKGQFEYLLKWACDVLADHYNHPDPLAFYQKYYESDVRWIGANPKTFSHANNEIPTTGKD